jgi:hypothetical protein
MSDAHHVLTIGEGQAGISARCQGYHFDLEPIFVHCESLRRHPDRAILMCQHQVRLLAPGELMLARESGFYLIIQSCIGSAADALANEVNLALLALFFGTDSLNGISALFRPVAYGEMLEAGIAAALPAPIPAAAKADESLLLMRFTQGRDLKSGFLPMLNLQREAPSIYMCGAVSKRGGQTVFGTSVFRDCDPKDRPALDVAMLEYGLGFARQIVPTKYAAAVCCGVSFETLAWSRGRQLYLQALRAAGMAANPFFIIKIEDVPLGTTSARLAELVAMVRPLVRRVFVQLPDCEIGLMQSGHIGAAGLCITLPPNASPPTIVRLANQLRRAAMVQQALSCVDGMEGGQALPLLRALGIRFAAACPDDRSIQLGGFPLEAECSSRSCAA